MAKQRISKHFTYDEFECKCGCGTMEISATLLETLERLRERVGMPIIVTSGFRCPDHPESIKRPNSYHPRGEAADITCPDIDLLDLYFAAEQEWNFRNGGIGIYPSKGFIHVDIRQKYARWGYLNGAYIGIARAIRGM